MNEGNNHDRRAHEYNTVSQSAEFDNQKIEFMAGDECFSSSMFIHSV